MLLLFFTPSSSVSSNVVESIATKINKLAGVLIGVANGGGNGGAGGGGNAFWMERQPSNAGIAFAVTALAGLALAAAVFYTTRGHLKSPWSRRKRKRALTPQQWRSFFTPEGKFRDSGVKFLKKVRSGGVDPSIRPEVWPFLLGVREYESFRRDCRRLLKRDGSFKLRETGGMGSDGEGNITEGMDSPDYEDVVTARESLSSEDRSTYVEDSDNPSCTIANEFSSSKRVTEPNDVSESESSDSDSSADPDISQTVPSAETMDENTAEETSKEESSPSKTEVQSRPCCAEDFATWQRIIRLDAIRANAEWIAYSPSQAIVSESRAHRFAEAVGLKDYEHLEPPRILHAARLDEVGIRRQLNIISKIIKQKDSHLYRHLEKLQAEDCFFVYRMVVVLFRRELSFEQTLCLWEVMWADQAAIRAGIGKSAWSRIRLRAPPTDDLLLYAIAASVLQRRKQIIEKYSSMDEILRECQSMAGQLDVWKLLDDAHDLVVTLHDKI
ncbi:rab GTPase-activating protein 22 isoform X6 [Capsicum annuum]|uniref:rab GTPase-activating protein 22 isoform X6 n=1 Tax=Capsicum annuum TaxID=4072 RepID=UPI001FB0610B|nr:rab GTPase-activating protein 22 isoform X6 [Capsicum annuum]